MRMAAISAGYMIVAVCDDARNRLITMDVWYPAPPGTVENVHNYLRC